MGSAEQESITGSEDRGPQRGPGTEPPVRGGQRPEAEHLFALLQPEESANLS